MPPIKTKTQGNSGGKNPHLKLVHGKYRFNSNTNVPVSHPSCVVSLRSKLDKERDRVTRVRTYESNAKGIFH